MKKQYLIGLDTETCNNPLDEKGRPIMDSSLVYDIGWVVTDRDGKIYKTRSFVIEEIFRQCEDIMKEAHFSSKIPQYEEEIRNGNRKLVSIWEARQILFEDMLEYNIETIFAHNTRFDVNALNYTLRYITSSKFRFFFPRETIFWDTMKMASSVVAKKAKYIKFCNDNGYMTKHRVPRVQTTAEVIYKFITGNNEFVESHTGLEDVEIETQILVYCFKQHKKMEKEIMKRELFENRKF